MLLGCSQLAYLYYFWEENTPVVNTKGKRPREIIVELIYTEHQLPKIESP